MRFGWHPAPRGSLVRIELEPLRGREVLVRNRFMSVDPCMHGRMNQGQSYVPPFELGKPLDDGAVRLRNLEIRAKPGPGASSG